MSKIEKIRFGNTEFDLVVGGVELSDDGGKITFQMSGFSLDEIRNILKKNNEISQIGLTEKTDWVREDLIYAGKLSGIDDYLIETDEETGNDIKADVAIAEFKLPDLNDRIAALEIENASMKESLGALMADKLANMEVK